MVALNGGNKHVQDQDIRQAKKSETMSLVIHEPFVSKELENSHLVAETLLDCIRTGDLEAFREVMTAHLMTTNKMAIAKKAGIGRRTLYEPFQLLSKLWQPEAKRIIRAYCSTLGLTKRSA